MATVDSHRAWRALRSLLQSWRKQDEEGVKVVEAICATISQGVQIAVQVHRVNAAARHLSDATAGSSKGVPGDTVEDFSSVLDLFPGSWSNLRAKMVESAFGAGGHFKQLDAMLAVLNDLQRSMDTLLEGQLQAVLGSPGAEFSQSSPISEKTMSSLSVVKGQRTLMKPVCAMDSLDWMERVAGAYRAELRRKKNFVSYLKRAANGHTHDEAQSAVSTGLRNSDEAADVEGVHGTKNITQSGAASIVAASTEDESGDGSGDFNPSISQFWSTDTSPASMVRTPEQHAFKLCCHSASELRWWSCDLVCVRNF